jgi:hypothetical protein
MTLEELKVKDPKRILVEEQAKHDAAERYPIVQEAFQWTAKAWEERFGEGVVIDPKYQLFRIDFLSEYVYPPLYHRLGLEDDWTGLWRDGVPAVRIYSPHGYGLLFHLNSCVALNDKRVAFLNDYEWYEWKLIKERVNHAK